MAKARGKNKGDGKGGARQQKLPLMWDEEPEEKAAKPTEESSSPPESAAEDAEDDSQAEEALTPENQSVPEIEPGPDEAEQKSEKEQAVPQTEEEVEAETQQPKTKAKAEETASPDTAATETPEAAEPDTTATELPEETAPPAAAQEPSPPEPKAEQDMPAKPPEAEQLDESGKGAARSKRTARVRKAASAHSGSGAEPGPAEQPADEGESVGDMLMAARADLGFSVEEASARTRVARNIIENLECNAFTSLPAPFYCQAHIERLCDLYNVDPEPILERFERDTAALKGHEPVLDHVKMASHESESGSMIRPMPESSGGFGGEGQSISVTGILVSVIIGLFMIAALWALIALHLRNRDADEGAGDAALDGVTPAVELNEFIVPKQLEAYELPIPDDSPE